MGKESKVVTQEETLASLESHIKDIDKGIQDASKGIETTEKRLPEIEKKVKNAKEHSEKLREQRQATLASGKNASVITREIADFKEELEEAEDELIGLQNLLESLKDRKSKLHHERIAAEDELIGFKLRCLVPEYNKTAEVLAKIVKEIWELKMKISGGIYGPIHPVVGSIAGWENNALDSIPQLYILGEDPEPLRYSFFYFLAWQIERRG